MKENVIAISDSENGGLSRGTAKRTVLLVEDQPIVRFGLTHRINREPDFQVIGLAETGAEGMAAILRSAPDIVLLDLGLPHNHGLEVLRDIQAQHPRLPVLIFSTSDELVFAERALRFGARGYVMKNEPLERLLQGMRTVLKGGLAVSSNVSNRMLQTLTRPGGELPEQSFVASLGNRELEVFQSIGQGKATREIAGHLGLSVKTIETYRERIKEKLNVRSSAELARQAVCWVEVGV